MGVCSTYTCAGRASQRRSAAAPHRSVPVVELSAPRAEAHAGSHIAQMKSFAVRSVGMM